VTRRVLDVSRLPSVAFGPRDPTWWGVVSLVAIEGKMLVLLAVSYIFVFHRTAPFPPTHVGTGVAWLATVEVVLWVGAVIAQHMCSKACVEADLPRMRRTLIVANLFALWACVLRLWIFAWLPFRWDDHAYGSVVWALLGVQWLHGITSVLEDAIYVVLFYRGPIEERHRVDIEVTSPLMDFVLAGTLLIWALVFAPILFGGGR
jgi:heme/copper-type cytochrome/quinol oxidase subunit 3